jgi:hypothetical protein
MLRIVFAAAIVVFALATGSGVSHAAPMSPLPAGVANQAASGDLTQAYCGWRCRHWCRWHRC